MLHSPETQKLVPGRFDSDRGIVGVHPADIPGENERLVKDDHRTVGPLVHHVSVSHSTVR